MCCDQTFAEAISDANLEINVWMFMQDWKRKSFSSNKSIDYIVMVMWQKIRI